MGKDTQRIGQFDTLENAVIQNDLQEVKERLRYSPHLGARRTLGLALRYCGPQMVKVLLEYGTV